MSTITGSTLWAIEISREELKVEKFNGRAFYLMGFVMCNLNKERMTTQSCSRHLNNLLLLWLFW